MLDRTQVDRTRERRGRSQTDGGPRPDPALALEGSHQALSIHRAGKLREVKCLVQGYMAVKKASGEGRWGRAGAQNPVPGHGEAPIPSAGLSLAANSRLRRWGGGSGFKVSGSGPELKESETGTGACEQNSRSENNDLGRSGEPQTIRSKGLTELLIQGFQTCSEPSAEVPQTDSGLVLSRILRIHPTNGCASVHKMYAQWNHGSPLPAGTKTEAA